jgi:hypothetical protein
MIDQEDGMFTFLFKRRKREQGPPLNETQRALVAKKFEILRQASFGFTPFSASGHRSFPNGHMVGFLLPSGGAP